MAEPAPLPLALRAYLAATRGLSLVAPLVLRQRLKRGKEDPARWPEKLGHSPLARPPGPLVWLHAVGLGEVQALRGLIARMGTARPDLSFLVTSTALSSGQVFAASLPPRTIHQYLPLDLPGAAERFLDHWQPSLSVWAEQDLWPGLLLLTRARGIPVAMVNARMDAESFGQRSRGRAIYAPLLARMAYLSAQDPESARHLTLLGARDVAVTGALKAASPPLLHDPTELDALRASLGDRPAWLLASSHPEDEAVALAVQAQRPGPLLVIAPRDPSRAAAIAGATALSVQVQSQEPLPRPGTQVFIADRFGQMGLWYRLCPVSLMGGTFGPTEGHNPWEPARLGSAILHGPRTANFRADYAQLDAAGGALPVAAPDDIALAMTRDFTAQRQAALACAEAASAGADTITQALLSLIAGAPA